MYALHRILAISNGSSILQVTDEEMNSGVQLPEIQLLTKCKAGLRLSSLQLSAISTMVCFSHPGKEEGWVKRYYSITLISHYSEYF